ncbi:MAG: di-trans,poly-cis-decaprenylcistransferase [Nitrososphaerota archaeon]|jgi:tritrans,polycis-undecaprenyl-diphosphate synthase [geranylgeranyl-diphosphate specific]|nr:di-trans,poly-cis-decaprenylcistransferase [Nitrososphaerota archaeon]MDG6942056.1 di-trans,poly-cis-decaprenylcistransferase [Nitrososphaerota archaeon]MDG6942521.1 di-trans,poly-cis-decaprenylcistransferase [Nitrososphaerota archaeon]MDG6948308.1 di-trans,poly-cis-decaprenylcistransferase [Nitrososphaerota archaeon]MDG6950234.1 di-trans,poly-cis-decaprenylcistransferase [Nitrososphaerota archaeon]
MLESVLRYLGAYKFYEGRLKAQVEREEIPSHIGIILDGNRRWAQIQGVSDGLGHEEGANRAEELLDWCHDLGIKTVTLYVLSTENLDRTPEELAALFGLIEARLNRLLSDARIARYRVKVRAIGHLDLLPKSIVGLLTAIEEKTAGYSDHYLNIAVAYGGRAEITDVVRSVAQDVKSGKLSPDAITEDTVSKRLYTAYLPNQEPDLIIRTSGEERMSGFLLWQGAYSELVFVDVFWPAFRYIDLLRGIRTYQKRRRRYGR